MYLELLILLVMILISVAFFTLSERKILSLSQIRLGPNKLSFLGIIQPIMDGVKLLKKSITSSFKKHDLIFKLMTLMIFFLSLLIWIIIPFTVWSNKILIPLFMMVMFGLSSYMVLMLGWSSMTTYSFLGGNRSLAQVLSFELIISVLILIFFLDKMKMSWKFSMSNSLFLTFFMSIIYLMSIFLETHRAPMDLAEGESELVSGYNTEFSSLYFVMIFLSEYSTILFMSVLYFMLWFKLNWINLTILMFIVILVRSCFPRIRYDHIMSLVWIKILPLLIMFWIMLVNLSF
uniref:NADH-ubiquinone oxidoreductase chain 1 n=1 Tax=Hexamermis agrotis TaxID=387665 RepID=A2TN46_9BILA|nr:NADH dehydrogenase subunit 1 [Hexamermis agrotis]ABM79863.1 NADH dehydrogenase subunit 1 [Hexamermis agrotis]